MASDPQDVKDLISIERGMRYCLIQMAAAKAGRDKAARIVEADPEDETAVDLYNTFLNHHDEAHQQYLDFIVQHEKF